MDPGPPSVRNLQGAGLRFPRRVSPYRGADREQGLREQADATLAAVDDLLVHTADIQPGPRPLSAVRDVDGYVAVRVKEQIHGYYWM